MRKWLCLLALACVTAAACSSEDDSSSKASTTRWDCYEGADGCWCIGFSGSGESGSSDPKVEACSAYPCCIAKQDGSDWDCECSNSDSCADDAAAQGDGAMVVDSCPLR
jgi:hypothetical protein